MHARAEPPFQYLADPLCVSAMVLYCLNRWLIKPLLPGGGFCHDYLNDLLCLPLFLPIILRAQSLLRIRRHDGLPTFFEVIHNWIVLSVLYEVILPRLPVYHSVADAWDVVAYLAGGLIAYGCWHRGEMRWRRRPGRKKWFLGWDTVQKRIRPGALRPRKIDSKRESTRSNRAKLIHS